MDVALDIPDERGRDPLDAIEPETAHTFHKPCRQLGRKLVAPAGELPRQAALDCVEAGPEGQEQESDGTVFGPVAGLRGPDERRQNGVAAHRIGAATEFLQKSGGIARLCSAGSPARIKSKPRWKASAKAERRRKAWSACQ
jgi:hypothetical protein